MIDLTYFIGTQIPRAVAPFYPDLVWRYPSDTKVVYFTFDDGPTPSGTPLLLDILTRFDVKASFFLLGAGAERDPGMVRALADAGHTLGNHTYSHPNAWRFPQEKLIEEMNRTTALLEDHAQQPIRWMRPPYGLFTTPMRQWCVRHHHQLTMWDVGVGDFLERATSRDVERRVRRGITPGSIVVLHDNPKANGITPRALANLVEQLLDEGWRFATLDDFSPDA